jgi:CrcB protein
MDGSPAPECDGNGLPVDPDVSRGRPAPAALAAVALGGMAGASARYGVNRWLPTPPDGFPWATFWINVSGSFLVGLVLVGIVERLRESRLVRPFLVTGVLGAFTTMSTYQVETALLVKEGHPSTAALYSLGSLAVGLAAAGLGLVCGRAVWPAPAGADA